jgi:hypothetical protein
MQRTLGSIKRNRMGLLPKLAAVLACALAMGASAANITVPGLNDVVKGTVYAEVQADEPVAQVKMEIPGVVNRIERMAPYGLMSDKNGKLNPLDTTEHADGDYVLTVTVTFEDGSEVVETFPFKIDNVAEQAPVTAPVKDVQKDIGIDLSSMPGEVVVGQTVTLKTTGLPDGAVVWYHLFDNKWGDLIRSTVKVQDNELKLEIPATSGDRILQLQYKNDYKVKRRLLVSAKPADPVTKPIPTPEPTPDTNPTPEPDPEPVPEVEVISIKMGSIPASLTPGQKLTLDVTGIDDGATVYFHMFNKKWGDLIRANVVVAGGQLKLTIPETTGERILQLQYRNAFKANKTVVVSAETAPEVDPPSNPEPTPDPETTPDPEPTPKPAPVQASIDLSTVPSYVSSGQRVSVQVKGIADGESLFFHLFDSKWSNLIRRNVVANNGQVEFVIPDVSGKRILQLQYQNKAKVSKSIFVESGATAPSTGDSTEVPDTGNDPIDSNPNEPDEDNSSDGQDSEAGSSDSNGGSASNSSNGNTSTATPDGVPTLKPGSGWNGATSTPEPVGSSGHPGYPYNAIAQWGVVPYQVFSSNFTIGVAAFHSYGIDRVAFSVDNGPWVSASEMRTNPRTKADEYFVNLDASKFDDGEVVVRAIAYPNHGRPYVLSDMVLFANHNGSMKFPVYELGKGVHTLPSLDHLVPSSGWLTIKPKPGVSREECIVKSRPRFLKTAMVKFQGLTHTHSGGNNFAYGPGRGMEGWVWFDQCKIIGNGRVNATNWLAHLWNRQFYTDCHITKVRSVFHGGGGGLFARNIVIRDIYEDVFRSFGYVTNVDIDGVDRGDTAFHPDLFEFATGWTQHQVIFHNLKVRNAGAQGMAGGNIVDSAMVNVDVETTGLSAMQMGHVLKNVLIQNSRFRGGARLRNAQPDGLVFRDSVIGWKAPLYLPENWDQPGVTILPRPPLYD